MHSGTLKNFWAVFPGDWSRSFLAACSFGRENEQELRTQEQTVSLHRIVDECKVQVDLSRTGLYQGLTLRGGQREICPHHRRGPCEARMCC